MRRLILLALLALLALAPAAGAHTTITDSGRAWQLQRWVDRSKMPTVDLEVSVRDERCPNPDAVACAYLTGPIYISPALTGSAARITLSHELGHVYDAQLMTNPLRAQLSQLMGWTGPWNQYEQLGHGSPNELFADLYADCATARSLAPYRPWRRQERLPALSNRLKLQGCMLIATAAL